MTFTIQHYAESSIVLLDCPNPLDYERGLRAVEIEISTMLEQTSRVYCIIDVHDMGVFFEMFALQLQSQGHDTLFSQHVMITLVGGKETIEKAEPILNRSQLGIPMFETLSDAFSFCENSYTRAVGD